MPQSKRSPVIPFVAIERPACPKCKAPMMLASIEPVRAGVERRIDVVEFVTVCQAIGADLLSKLLKALRKALGDSRAAGR